MKECSKCKELLSLDNFWKRKESPDGLHKQCKKCRSNCTNSWKRKEKDVMAKARRKSHLKIKYNLSVEDYNKMFLQQDGCCAICNKHQSLLNKKLFVDHCHKTEKVRKLLCYSCNTLLGMAKDNIDILNTAIQYLHEFGYDQAGKNQTTGY